MQNSREECITDEATKKIHDYVEKVKVAPEVKETYMKFEEIMAYNREQGELMAKRRALLDVLEIYEAVPMDLQKQIEQTEDVELLGKWLILAVKSGSIPRFMEKIKNE